MIDEVRSGLFDGLTKETLVDIVAPMSALVTEDTPTEETDR